MKLYVKIRDLEKGDLTDELTSNNKKYVHHSVSGGVCSGFQYNWNFIDEDKDGKVIDDLLVLDNMAVMFVFGCTVDYIKELGGSYLKVINPNAKASCGCGESFAV